MTRRPFGFLGLLLLLFTPLFAELVPGAARALDQPELRPWPTYSGVELTENDGVFLASWSQNEAVRLDRDGDALDRPPLQLGVVPYGGLGDHAVADGDGWIIPTRVFLNEATSALLFQRLSAEGTVTRAGELTISRSLGTLDVEGSDGEYAVLYTIEGAVTAGIITFDASIRASQPLVLNGFAVGLAAGDGTFAALFRDRVVILSREPAVLRTVALPSNAEHLAIAPFQDGFAVAATNGTSIIVYRIGAVATQIATIPGGQGLQLAFDSSGDALLLAWRIWAQPGVLAPLRVARVTGGGAVEGPVTLAAPATDPEVEGDDEGWLVAWTDPGWQGDGIVRTRRVDADEPLASIADDIDPVVWKAPSATAVAIATSGDVALAVWLRQGGSARGVILDRRGERIGDEIDLPSGNVVGREEGFLAYTSTEGPRFVAHEVTREGVVAPAPILLAENDNVWGGTIECPGEICLAAWRTGPHDSNRESIRVARIKGSTVLDPGGVAIAFPGPALSALPRLDVASDGSGFLVTWIRDVLPGGGTIVSAALIDPSGGLEYRTFDVMATNEAGYYVYAVWNGSVYELIRTGLTDRLVRVRPDGSVIEGEESGWAGWPLDVEGTVAAAFRACGTTHFASEPAFAGSRRSVIYGVEARSAREVANVPVRVVDVACLQGRACLAIGDDWPPGRIPQPGVRAWIVPLSCARERLVGK